MGVAKGFIVGLRWGENDCFWRGGDLGEQDEVLATFWGAPWGTEPPPHHPPATSPCPPDDYKEFGVNCERMASEIEERILWGLGGPGGGQGQGQRVVGPGPWGVPARSLQREPGAH